MINLRLKADPNGHVCEIQLVHNQMLTARKELPGHAVYNRVRNASEMLASLLPTEEEVSNRPTRRSYSNG